MSYQRISRIGRLTAVAVSLLLIAGGLTACSLDLPDVVPWLDETSEAAEDTGNMVIHITGSVPETDVEPATAENGADTAADPGNGIPYTGEAHAGTDIYYVGTGANRARVIVIDAGHQARGNSDKEPVGPGAEQTQAKVSYGTTGTFTGDYEFELNLRVALALRDELIARGYSVVMIRETNDVDVSNAERAQIANRHKAAALIRIHANGWNDEKTNGAMTVCQTANNPYPECAAVYKESRLLSECILSAYCEATGFARYSLWETDTKAGTNWSAVPSTILEMGFMTNREDDERMASDEFKPIAAKGIADGLDDYFAKLSQ